MYLVKRSPYPFIQVYPFIKDLRVGIAGVGSEILAWENVEGFFL